MHICIDDFGTGYCSLSCLKRLPVETIKIDRSFVDGLGREQEDTAIVRAVIGMAGSLRLLCVAEGVETDEQVLALRALGCHIAQDSCSAVPGVSSSWPPSPATTWVRGPKPGSSTPLDRRRSVRGSGSVRGPVRVSGVDGG